jgi:GxxExxY protein
MSRVAGRLNYDGQAARYLAARSRQKSKRCTLLILPVHYPSFLSWRCQKKNPIKCCFSSHGFPTTIIQFRIMTAQELNRIGAEIVDAAIKVHRALGPGLLESAYKFCMKVELESRNLKVEMGIPLQLTYLGQDAGKSYELDMLVEGAVIIEFKAVEQMKPLYQAQALTYLKLYPAPLGYLINFNVARVKDGLKRLVWNFPK